jgi:tetratricopeptide (TPR) repeat protein
MALWLQPGEEPETAEERADLDAIIALRESAAIELKEKGNEYVKMGKMHFKEAVDCYTRAIDQKSSDPLHNSICYSNRAHVELLLGNNRRAYSDAQEAIKANPVNIKAYFRGAKAALALGLHSEASNFCVKGLELDPKNDELKKIRDKMQKQLAEEDARSKRVLEKKHRAEVLQHLKIFSNVNPALSLKSGKDLRTA